jgi:glycogen debranching enzyme
MTDLSPWNPEGPVPSLAHAGGDVTLVEGQTFCLSGRTGDMSADLPQGLFVLDTRVLSRWQLYVNNARLEALTVSLPDPFAATFVGRGRPEPGKADADVVVFRHRHVGRGMRERLVITNHGLTPATLDVELRCDVDFADLFEVKASRVTRRGWHSQEISQRRLSFAHQGDGVDRTVIIRLSEDAMVQPGVVRWNRTLASRTTWELCCEVEVTLGDTKIEPRFRCGVPDHDTVPFQRLASWRATLPIVETECAPLALTVARSGEDLGALRIFDPENLDLAILAAGAPWFMTVFGRDSLITAWMTLLADSTLARGVLQILARFQGADVNPETEEEPGKILHEMRFGAATGLALGGGDAYYGSVDSTPLFVMLLGELRRWDIADDLVQELMPNVNRAMAWIEEFGDRDGDGYVEYERYTPNGLFNQGWKDSWDAVRFADGRLARTPIALCEVQGYVHAAYVARAHFAREESDHDTFVRYRDKAVSLRERFNRDFWCEEHGWYALALDGDKKPVDALASNIGHCLWTGIVDPDKAAIVAPKLVSREMFSGWGVRTLASDMAAYNPVSYHNGSVWPHDNAICAAGLVRYGFVEEAHLIINGILDAAAATGGRLPELFAGLARDEFPGVVPYPTSCSPQAWAAATPLAFLRAILRLDPWVPHNQIWMAPKLLPGMSELLVRNINLGGGRVEVTVTEKGTEVEGLPDGIELVTEPRNPMTAQTPTDASA